MDIYQIARIIALISLSIGCLAGMMGGLLVYYQMYFWINKLDRKNNVNPIKGGNSWIGRLKRSGAVMWLTISLSHGKFDRWLRNQIEKDYYGAAYLKISPDTLRSLRWRGHFFLVNFIIFLCGFLIYMLLEKFV